MEKKKKPSKKIIVFENQKWLPIIGYNSTILLDREYLTDQVFVFISFLQTIFSYVYSQKILL